MSTILIEAFSGLSGDMFLSALTELANAHNEILNLPELLNLPDGKVEINKLNKNGIVCNHVKVIDLNKYVKNKQVEKHHQHHHRHLSDIIELINNAQITDNAKQIAKDIFLIIGKSESKIHNVDLSKIHFHEVSGVDSIIDIVGCAYLIDKLSIKKAYSTAVCTGFGFVMTQHGKLPVPAPATADILAGIPIYAGDEKGERVTPTGAAILKYLDPEFEIPVLKLEKIVYGPGWKDFTAPNVLRISLVKEEQNKEKLFILETNIDDFSNEFLGKEFQDELLKKGAIDFYFTHIQMKKARPGILLSCSVLEDNIQILSDYIMENTSTIGVRYFPVERKKLTRKINEIETQYGKVRIKKVETPSGQKRTTIEYEDLAALSKKHGIPMQLLQQRIIKEIE
ncbi:MAG: nickel pincer cofactor biosynthesis protein LarC [Bacteroidota bacterium]